MFCTDLRAFLCQERYLRAGARAQEAVTKEEAVMGGVPIPRSAFLRFTEEMHCQLHFPYPGEQVRPRTVWHASAPASKRVNATVSDEVLVEVTLATVCKVS